jgi:ubiquinone/menaquinone biosynthesis C-methylase UbiE
MMPADVDPGHAARIERAFAAQAAAFEDARTNRPFTTDAAWMLETLSPARDDLVLDVAAGTGIVARALAPAVRAVVALDATEAMLAAGRSAALETGMRNIVFVRGDAHALPFLDASFDVVVTRFSVHHFEAPAGPLAEMARCLRPGGTPLVGDLLADDDPAVATEQDRLERLRDPSHTRLQTAADLEELLHDAGMHDVAIATRDVERPLAPWPAHTRTAPAAAEEVERALRAELAGGAHTGLRPREAAGGLHFVHRYAAATGRRPPTALP